MTKTDKQEQLSNNWAMLIRNIPHITKRTIVCPTGFGKTRLGLNIIKKAIFKKNDRKIFISVSNEAAYNTWNKVINDETLFPKEYVKNIKLETIGVTMNRNKVSSLDEHYYLIIVDEIHKYISEDRKEFLNGMVISCNYGLGLTGSYINELSSTYPTDDSILVTEEEAIRNKWISEYIEYNLAVDLTDEDRVKYKTYSAHIDEMMRAFSNNYDLIQHCYSGSRKEGIAGDVFRQQVANKFGWNKDLIADNPFDAEIIKYWSPGAIYDRCKLFNEYVAKRKDLINNNIVKLNASVDLYFKLGLDRKTIIFSENTSFADKVCHAINCEDQRRNSIDIEYYNPIVVSYHSNISSRPLIDPNTGEYIKQKNGKTKIFGTQYFKKRAIEGLINGEYKGISTCNALNDSLDIEDISFIISTGGTVNPVTEIQRTGRGKRYVHNKTAIIVNIYFMNTRDEQKLKQRQNLNQNEIRYINSISEISLTND